ncbi:hypothetical protein FBU30_009230 [Linnemannia zychae]|nr:hypothetical protein FBU30_009230 [Linnemannia zychae]
MTAAATTNAATMADNTSEHDHSTHKEGHCRQSMQIENSHCNYDAVEAVNLEMRDLLDNLVRQKYFKFYKKTIPEEWTSAALGAISSPTGGKLFQPFQSCSLKDQDFCQVDDEAVSEGVYVDLMENPERFTGYSGPSAAKVWGAIYDENCFNVAQKMQLAAGCEQCSLDRETDEEDFAKTVYDAVVNGISYAQNPLSTVKDHHGHHEKSQKKQEKVTRSNLREDMSPSMSPALTAGLGAQQQQQQDEEMCLEKRVFYRMISGLHASISIHICDEYFNQTSGVWGPNLECFVSRVGAHPDRLENIFFDYSILVRAVTKLSGYLHNYEFCTGNPEEDTKAMVDKLIEVSNKSPAIFDEKAMFVGPDAQALKLQFRDHFRNITKIMDCVGCEKCRLWGKVQTSGLGTALKILFSYNDEHLNPIKHPNLLQRTEIVALFNTLNRVSESVASIARFRTLYMEQHGLPIPATPTPSQSSSKSVPEHQEDVSKTIQSYFSELFKDTPALLASKNEHESSKKDKKETDPSARALPLWRPDIPQGLSAALREKILDFSRRPLGGFFQNRYQKSGSQKQQHPSHTNDE